MRKAETEAPEVGPGIHLNIGCGAKLWPGFVNIDFPGNWSGKAPDIECDIRAIPLPDDHADSAYAIHVLEHFYRHETLDVLTEWMRVLKPGGELVIEVPCLDKVIQAFNYYIKNKIQVDPRNTMWRLYGDPKYQVPEMVHKWCFSVHELIDEMTAAGLKDVHYCDPVYHAPSSDMRIVGTK